MEKEKILGLIHQAINLGAAEHHEAKLGQEQLMAERAAIVARDEAVRKVEIVEGIPEVVRKCRAQGHAHGVVMRLRFDESAEQPNDMSGYWHDTRQPNPAYLTGAAKHVWDVCSDAHLGPYLVRDYDFTIHKFFLYLGIKWSPPQS
jgi:hypothetical protein